MKQFLQLIYILILLCIATTTHAQNKEIEAIATFEMAEEQFNVKNYIQALEYVNKTKTTLGKSNAKILFLGIQILNELSKTDAQYLEDALNAILVFEKMADAEQFSEEKRIVIAKVKLDLDKRKNAYEKKIALEGEYDKMLYRLASEFPKTETNVSDLFTNVQVFWQSLLSVKEVKKSGKKPEWLVKRMIKEGGWNYFDREDIQKDQYVLKAFTTYKPNEDRVKEYDVNKILSLDKKSIKRSITVEEICSVLNITPNMWFSFTSGEEPLIKIIDNKAYSITKMIAEKGIDGERKYFAMYIYKETYINRDSEDMWINIYKNTL